MMRQCAVIVCVVHLFYSAQVSLAQALELNMMPNTFDDQYIGCEEKMEQEMVKVLEEERDNNHEFNVMWKKATDNWSRENLNLPDSFKDEYGVAVVLYTMEEPYRIYRQLNGNLSSAGESLDYYMNSFPFKALHFYLTRALQVLRKGCAKRFTTYRGTFLDYTVSSELRFGRFASSSQKKSTAQGFGTTTFFTITTCFGVDINELSAIKEQEVLIPVAEKFRNVQKFYGNSYMLESTGELCSYFNCAYLRGEKRQIPVCNSGHLHYNALQMTGTLLYSGSRTWFFFAGLVLYVAIFLLH